MANFHKIISQLLLSLLFVSAAVSAVEKNSRIYLKNGKIVDVEIDNVLQRHLTAAEGEGILLRQIDSIFTTQTPAMLLFRNLDSSIRISESSGGYIIDLKRYSPHLRASAPIQPLTPSSVALHFRYDSYSNVGFQYDGVILERMNIIHRFQASIKLDQKHRVFSNLNFAFGAGYQHTADPAAYSCFLNYGVYGGFHDDEQTSATQQAVFLSPSLCLKISRLIDLNPGLELYFYRSNTTVPGNRVIAYLGVRIHLI